MPERQITRDQIRDLPVGAHFWYHFGPNNLETEWIKVSEEEAHTTRDAVRHRISTLADTSRPASRSYWYLREEDEMTATLTTGCPFPMVEEAIQNHDQLRALPVGSHVGYEIGDAEWEKIAPDRWAPLVGGEQRPADVFNVPYTNTNGRAFQVLSIPQLRQDQLRELPVGSVIWVNRDDFGAYVKSPHSGYGGLVWVRVGYTDRRNNALAGVAPTYLISTPEQPEQPNVSVGHRFERVDDVFVGLPIGTTIRHESWGEDVAQHYVKRTPDMWSYVDDTGESGEVNNRGFGTAGWIVTSLPTEDTEDTEAVTIPVSSVQPGMYLRTRVGGCIYVDKVDEGRWSGVFQADYEDAMPETLTSFSPDQDTYQIQPHDARLASMLLWKMQQDREQHERELANARREGGNQRDIWWNQEMERFNEAAKEFADRKDYCSDYDEFVQGWSHIGLTPREREWTVTMDVTVRHVRTVTAVDEDSAWERAEEETGFREGDTHSLHSEHVEITDVSEVSTEQA